MLESKRKLKEQIEQLKDENTELRYELGEQTYLAKQREKFGISEAKENRERKRLIKEIEKILNNNNYNNMNAELAKLRQIKEVISRQTK